MTAAPAPASRARAWLLAARPKTLPVGAAPVIVGTAAAAGAGALNPLAAGAALVGALLLQIGTNLVNDAADFARGADGPDRLGPARAVASGLLPARAVWVAAALAFAGATAVGVYLVVLGGWPIVIVGLAGIVAGVAYTAGPFPLAYRGLGDLFAFVFFGVVAVTGTFYVQAGHVTAPVVAAGAALGALAAAVLDVNNVRDLAADERAGKRTLAVRLGRPLARAYYAALLGAAYATVAVLAALQLGPLGLLPLATLPEAARLVRIVATREDGPSLNGALAGTARLLLANCILWAPAWAR